MRSYVDISHFRAPYKNAMIAGFGADNPATVAKTVQGYAIQVATADGASSILSGLASSGRLGSMIPKGSASYSGIVLPADSAYYIGATGPVDVINWMQQMAQGGKAVIVSDGETPGAFQATGVPQNVNGLVVATRNVALASAMTGSLADGPAQDAAVLIEPSAGWVLPDSPEAKAELSGPMSPAMMAAIGLGVVVAVGGVLYFSTHGRGRKPSII